MPCGFNGCDYNLFAVIIENWDVAQCYHLFCLECHNIREISFENFRLMKDLEGYLESTMMTYGTNWTKESIREEMMQYKVTGDMK